MLGLKPIVAHRISIYLATLSLLVGKLSTSRIPSLGDALPDIEVRVIALAIATIFLGLSGAFGRLKLPPVASHATALFGTFLAFVLYSVLAEIFVWKGGFASPYFVDLAFMLAFVGFFSVALRDIADLDSFAVALVVAGFGVFAGLLSLTYLPLGLTLEQFGSYATSYRVELTGACAALYLAGRRLTVPVIGIAFGLAAAALMYGALFSTSRTSVVVIAVVVVASGFGLVVHREWLKLLALALSVLCTVALLVLSPAGNLGLRIANAGGSIDAGSQIIDFDPIADAASALGTAHYKELCSDAMAKVVAGPVVMDTFSCTQSLIVYDGSQRLRLGLRAITLFMSQPIFGHGPDGYRLTLAYGKGASTYAYPHNVLLDVAARSGGLGLLLIGISVIAIAVVGGRARLRDTNSIYLGMIGLFYFVASLTSGDLYDCRLPWVIGAALCFLADRSPAQLLPRQPSEGSA